mgnify:CR=1 FL=1
MNVGEMHIAVQQGVDKINSLQADTLLPEEIDIELNKSMYKFINLKYGKNNIYRKGFEESQKRVDDLRSIIEEVFIPANYKEQLSNKYWIDTVIFPGNYMYYINSRSKVAINNCNPIAFNIKNAKPINYFKFDLNFLTNNNTGFLNSMYMRTDINDVTTANYLNQLIFQTPAGYTFPQDIMALKAWLIDPSNWQPGIQIYWETYGSLTVADNFLVIVDTDIYPSFNWDASVTNTYTSTNLITQLVGLDSTNNLLLQTGALYEQNIFTAGSRVLTEASETLTVENKFVQQDDIFTLLNDPFNTTKYTQPIFTVRENNMDLYTSDIFIIEQVKLTYLRIPIDISLSLGNDCELPDHTHREIVDMAVSSILEGITDPRYRLHELEVRKNE